MTHHEGLSSSLAPWLRRSAAVAVLFAAHQWASCHLVFKAEPSPPSLDLFLGCYIGEITSPPGSGKLKIILDQTGDGDTLSGCLETGPILATLSGTAEGADRQVARFTAVPNSGGSFSFRVTRQPPGFAQATTLDVENLNLSPFELATALPACTPGEVATCAQMFLAVPFLPTGQSR